MDFKTTQLALIERLKTRSMGNRWEQSWADFFEDYSEAIETCVKNDFYRKGWKSLADADRDEVVMDIFQAIYRDSKTGSFIEVDFSKGRFRDLIKAICCHKVSDFIRSKIKFKNNLPIENAVIDQDINQDPNLLDDQHAESENRAFLKAQVATLMAALHGEISPQSYQIFERVRLLDENPQTVADDLGIKRGVVDNSLYKTKKKLEQLVQQSAISKEFIPATGMPQPASNIETLVSNESLKEFKTLYKEHEAFQNSPKQQALSKRFEETVRQSEKLT